MTSHDSLRTVSWVTMWTRMMQIVWFVCRL